MFYKSLIIGNNQKYIKKFKNHREIKIIDSIKASGLNSYLKNNKDPDLIIWDLEEADKEYLKVLKANFVSSFLVFIAEKKKYIENMFKLNCIDFLSKPLTGQKINGIIVKLKNFRNNFIIKKDQDLKNKKISVKKDDKYYLISPEDIYYFKSYNRISIAYTGTDSFFYEKKLKEIKKDERFVHFIKVHKQYLISSEKISYMKKINYRNYKIILDDKKRTSIKVGRRYIEKVRMICGEI